MDLFAIKRGDEVDRARRRARRGLSPARRSTSRSSCARAASATRTRNGTADSNETWVSLEGEASGGGASATPFFRSGVLDAAGRLDPAADMLSTLVIDHDGGHMDRRQPQDIHVPLFNNGIGPGAARVVHYRVKVPKDAKGAITLTAGVHYRKFSRDYTTFSLGAASPSLPVTTLAARRGDSPVAGPQPDAVRVTGRRGASQARQPRPAVAALERLRHRPLPPGRLQGRGARVDEGGRARAGQAGRPA